MPVVEPFSGARFKRYLDKMNFKYLVDGDGDYLVQFAFAADVGGDLSAYLIAGGPKKDVCVVRITSTRPVDRPEWGRAMALCNQWNRERRWPKAYLYVRTPATDTVGFVHLEEQIDLEYGIHQELLDDFITTVIVTGNEFWKWAHTEHGL